MVIISLKYLKGPLHSKGAIIFEYYVKDPREFGVVEFDDDGNVISRRET